MKMFERLINSRAAQWFTRARFGQIDSSSDKAWADWMAADERHQQAYENLELAWELTEELRARPQIQSFLKDIDRTLKADPRARAKMGLFDLSFPWQAGLAACALVVVCAISALLVRNWPNTAEYSTGVGEQRTVTLADNSMISLNTRTRVQVRYSGAVRHIELLDGEALFSVIKDSKRPFEVRALHGTTTAVGTEFDVQLTSAAVAVSVLKGTVAVQSLEKPQDGRTAQISAGEAVDYTAEGTTSAIRSADTDKVRAWQAQRILITNAALADALADYNRYTKTPIVLGDPDLASRHINGVFRIGDETAFLNALEQGLHVTVTRTDSAVVLHRR
jgi:transmembrane sensor